VIPFGGAGTGAFIQQVADFMTANAQNYQADEAGFLKAFEDGRQAVLKAISSSGNNLKSAAAHGVVLAAIPVLSSPAHILRLDFASGGVTTCSGDLAAEGTAPAAFTDIARSVLSGLSGDPVDATELTQRCLDRAIALCPDAVGWPMDLRVTESGSVALLCTSGSIRRCQKTS